MEQNLVDFWPIVEMLLAAVGIILAGAATWGIGKIAPILKERWGIQIDDSQRMLVESALRNGIRYAVGKAGDLAKERSKIEVKNELVRVAAGYAASNVPDALRRLGVTTEAGGKLEQLIESRIDQEIDWYFENKARAVKAEAEATAKPKK